LKCSLSGYNIRHKRRERWSRRNRPLAYRTTLTRRKRQEALGDFRGAGGIALSDEEEEEEVKVVIRHVG